MTTGWHANEVDAFKPKQTLLGRELNVPDLFQNVLSVMCWKMSLLFIKHEL